MDAVQHARDHARGDASTGGTHERTADTTVAETRAAERAEAQQSAGADRAPTAEEEARADAVELDPDVVAHEEEMLERGAHQQGEGRLP